MSVNTSTTSEAGHNMNHDADNRPIAGSWRGRRSASAAAGVLVVALCLSLSGCFAIHEVNRWQNTQDHADARSSAIRVATDAAMGLSTLDSATIAERTTDLLGMSVGRFRQQLLTSRAGQIASVRSAKTISTGHIDAAGIVTLSDNAAVVAVALTAKVSDAAHKVPQAYLYRVEVDLQHQSGRWVVESLEFVQ